MAKYNLIALTNPLEGRDAEFNDWYTNEHLADVLKLPGVTGAQRYRMSDVQHRPGPFEWKYMAVYEIEIDDIKELSRRCRPPAAPTPCRCPLRFPPTAWCGSTSRSPTRSQSPPDT